MRKYLLFLVAVSLFLSIPIAAQETIPAPEGWRYFGGDEFNGETVDASKWLVYGTGGAQANYGQPQGMIQTYRPEQVTMATLPTGEQVLRIKSVKRTDGNVINGQTGWWSGAIGSREKNVYYPLYSRMDVRAKVANEYGVWHAIWNRYRIGGAGTAEIDILECFVKNVGKNVVSQSIHLWDYNTNKTTVNVHSGYNKLARPSDIANTFHTYSVVIEKDPNTPQQAIISFLVDDVLNYSFPTAAKPSHNKFIIEAENGGILNAAWDMVVTGQIGANSSYVGFPQPELTEVVTELDYFRVFVKNEATGLSTSQNADLKIFIHNDILTVDCDEEISSIQIFNKMGQLIINQLGQEKTVNISHLPKETFIVRVRKQDGTPLNRKMIK